MCCPVAICRPFLSLRAKRSNLGPAHSARRDCFVATLLAMTVFLLILCRKPERAIVIDRHLVARRDRHEGHEIERALREIAPDARPRPARMVAQRDEPERYRAASLAPRAAIGVAVPV